MSQRTPSAIEPAQQAPSPPAERPWPLWLRPIRGLSNVWWLNALLTLAAVVVFMAFARDLEPFGTPHLSWWALAPAFFVAERCVVHLHFRRNAHSFSLGDIPLVLGLLFASPAGLLFGGLLGNLATLSLDRRLPPIKLVFNLAQFAVAATLATVVAHGLVPNPHGLDDPWLWTAVLLATELSALITVLAIGAAISLSEGPIRPQTLLHMFAMDLVVTMTNTTLALAASIVLSFDPRAIPLLGVPAITVFLAYRAYLMERQRHERLEFLYEATRTLSRSPEIVLALEGLLERSLEAFRAEMAEIVLFSSDGSPPLRTTLGPGDFKEVMEPMDDGVAEDLRSMVATDRPTVRLERPFSTVRLRRYLDGRRVTDAMLAMMPGETRVIGTIMLANRFGVIRSFSDDDLKLFEALANNASVALQYDRLEQAVLQLRELQEQLHHQAFHDPLTDLANRALFINRVKDALAGEASEIAVLFIDLDDFKTFNDSLGHAAGDDLLTAVAERLRQCVRPADVIARLGGDEFAVMVQDSGGVRQNAVAVACRVLESFTEPVEAADQLFSVHLSIGIATSDDTRKADALIRNADLAMYRAKETGKGGYEVFHSSMRDAVVKRHGLKEELQAAIEGGQVVVEYQPIMELSDCRVSAAEALVRWNHPARGRLLPAEFVPLAEETGLIVAVGRHVLLESCRQARAWQADKGVDGLSVHVNLSAVELKDPTLAAGVRDALVTTGLEPRLLVLEITESLMQDADASATALADLRELGVRLALDDFGTGYSSLSYLRSLPLDILKIAKPFVEGLSRGRQENSFVRMIVDLARALDLQVVAEGIESAEELEALRDLGCDSGQGFFLARPLDITHTPLPALLRNAQPPVSATGERVLALPDSVR
jgi:diguanylate cyclase (GGDEF)-like protein